MYGGGSGEFIVVVCHVSLDLYSGTGGCYILVSFTGKFVCGCGTSLLKYFDNCCSASVCFFIGAGYGWMGWDIV